MARERDHPRTNTAIAPTELTPFGVEPGRFIPFLKFSSDDSEEDVIRIRANRGRRTGLPSDTDEHLSRM